MYQDSQKTLGIIIADIRVDFFEEFIKAVEKMAKNLNVRIIIADSEENQEKEKRNIENFIKQGVSGIIIAPVDTSADLSLYTLTPIVQFDRCLDADLFDFVGIDNEAISYQLTENLIHQGHTNIGCLFYRKENYCARERIQGYSLAMRDHSLYQEEEIVALGLDKEKAQQKIDSFLLQKKQVTAILCETSNIVHLLLERMKALAMESSVTKIATFDDCTWFDFIPLSIDSVQQPIEQIALTALTLLESKVTTSTPLSVVRKSLLKGQVKVR